MVLTTIGILTSVAVVLLIGIVLTVIAKKIKISNILLLLIAGILLSTIRYRGEKLIEFPETLIASLGVLTLVLIIFDSTSKFKYKELDKLSISGLKLVGLTLVLEVLALTVMTTSLFFGFRTTGIIASLVFATLMAGTSPDTVLAVMGKAKNKIFEILEIESILNTPLTVLLPFIIVEFYQLNLGLVTTLIDQTVKIIQQIVTGIGSGVVVGIIGLQIMKRYYSEDLSPIAIIVTALISYSIAENLGGSGVLAVTALGLLFGNIYIKHKGKLFEFESILTNSLIILVFVLIGFIIDIPWTNSIFLIKATILFITYIGIRFLIVYYLFRENKFKEKLFISFNAAKGIATATAILALSSYVFEGIKIVLELGLIFMLYSITLSIITSHFASKMLRIKEKELEKI